MGIEVKRVLLDFAWPLEETWKGYLFEECERCKGAEDLCSFCEAYQESGEWEEEPPYGEGFQVWENVTEGSPVSPVLRTGEEVIEFVVVSLGYSRTAAERLVEDEYAPSFSIEEEGASVYIGKGSRF